MNRVQIGLKTIFGFLSLPLFFLFGFYFYFGIVSHVIYNKLDLGSIEIWLRLPFIFSTSFVVFGIFSLIFGLLLRWRIIFTVAFFSFLPIFSAVYLIQYYSLYYTNQYIIPEAFYHLDQIHLLVSPIMLAKLSAFLSILIGFAFVTYKASGWCRNASRQKGSIRSGFLQFVTTAFLFIVPYQVGAGFNENLDVAQFYGLPPQTPEVSFYRTIKQIWIPSQTNTHFYLPADVKDFVEKKYGLFYNLDHEYPQVKDWIYHKVIPFEKKPGATDRPNIILFFVESLSTLLLNKSTSLNLTSNIDDFTKESMSVKGYFNHTFPTINGLRGQLCSLYPILGEEDHSQHERVNYRLLGLPHVLNRIGYETAFFTYSPARYAPVMGHTLNIAALMRACGFSELYMAEDIQRRLLGLSGNDQLIEKSISDLGLAVDLTNILASRNSKSDPFLYVISTIGTHSEHGDYEGKLLDSVHNFDRAFGVFWKYFKKSPFYDNTIIIVTADHAMPPTVEYRQLAGLPKHYNYFFEEIVLLVFDKRYKLPGSFETKASSIDLTPSILQLLELNNFPNPFLGLSIFSDRSDYPHILSTMLNLFYVNDERGIREFRLDNNVDWLVNFNRNSNDILKDYEKQDLALKIWYFYNKYLNSQKKIWNMVMTPIR